MQQENDTWLTILREKLLKPYFIPEFLQGDAHTVDVICKEAEKGILKIVNDSSGSTRADITDDVLFYLYTFTAPQLTFQNDNVMAVISDDKHNTGPFVERIVEIIVPRIMEQKTSKMLKRKEEFSSKKRTQKLLETNSC